MVSPVHYVHLIGCFHSPNHPRCARCRNVPLMTVYTFKLKRKKEEKKTQMIQDRSHCQEQWTCPRVHRFSVTVPRLPKLVNIAWQAWVAMRVGKAKGARISAAGEVPQPPELKHPGFQMIQRDRLHTMNLCILANQIHGLWAGTAFMCVRHRDPEPRPRAMNVEFGFTHLHV